MTEIDLTHTKKRMILPFGKICFDHPHPPTDYFFNHSDAVISPSVPLPPLGEGAYCRGGLWHRDMTPKKAAVTLQKLFNEEWHTDLELTTDENGCVTFRGFYGDYSADIDGSEYSFGIHKDKDNTYML